MSVPIFPVSISFQEWASQIRTSYPSLYFPRPLKNHDWRFWASQVVLANDLPRTVYPTKLGFPKPEDWKKWATYFITNLPGGI